MRRPLAQVAPAPPVKPAALRTAGTLPRSGDLPADEGEAARLVVFRRIRDEIAARLTAWLAGDGIGA